MVRTWIDVAASMEEQKSDGIAPVSDLLETERTPPNVVPLAMAELDVGSAHAVPSTGDVKKEKAPENPIATAMSAMVYKLVDFEECAAEFVPVAEKARVDSLKGLVEELTELTAPLTKKPIDEAKRVTFLKGAMEFMPKIQRITYANPGRVLRESLFIGVFTVFDAFTGELLRALFERKPALFGSLKRQVDAVTILESETLEDVKRCLIAEEIECLRRESYTDQFSKLEGLFGVKLRSFSRWGDFIERSQRRNLLTHCDGIVNDQYLMVCKGAGLIIDEKVGVKRDVSLQYVKDTVGLLIEVGIKLGQTLWRKILPEEMEEADRSLNAEIYVLLCEKKWERASVLSKFAMEQPRFASDVSQKIFTVNHIIAAKFGGKAEEAQKMLASLDWSGAAVEFRLAKAVLEDRFEDACGLMLQIGKNGEIVKETSYHVFPLFHAFRLQECFVQTYEKVFGRPFSEKVRETMDEAKTQLEVQAKQNLEVVDEANSTAAADVDAKNCSPLAPRQ